MLLPCFLFACEPLPVATTFQPVIPNPAAFFADGGEGSAFPGAQSRRFELPGQITPHVHNPIPMTRSRTWEGTAEPVPTRSGAVPKKRLRLRGFNP